MNKSLNLFLLQMIDSKLDKAKIRIQQLKTILADRSQIEQAESVVSATSTQLTTANQALKETESKISTTRIKIQQSESSLYGGKIRNPKELQDFENEISILKKQIAALEEQQFAELMTIEEKQLAHQYATDALATIMQSKQLEHAGLTSEILLIEKEIQTIIVERDASLKSVDPVSLATYSRLRTIKANQAVSQVIDSECERCGMELTQADWQKARISSDLCFCSNCGRILYAK